MNANGDPFINFGSPEIPLQAKLWSWGRTCDPWGLWWGIWVLVPSSVFGVDIGLVRTRADLSNDLGEKNTSCLFQLPLLSPQPSPPNLWPVELML